MDITAKIIQANHRLKHSNVGVTIEQHGGRLRLRATLPPKPKSSKTRPWQQRVAIGVPANPTGLRAAETEAKLLGSLIAAKEFTWDRYLDQPHSDRKSNQHWIEAFHNHYISNGGTLTTWAGDYAKVLKHLAPDNFLDSDGLRSLVVRTKPNTKSRVRACMVAGALAKFAGIEFDPKPYRGNYSPSQVSPRNLPDDATIARCRETITNKSWQWVYGMMATYGLRNHECFKLDLEAFPVVRILDDTKTGTREVWPCFPEWTEQWNLKNRILPPIQLDRSNDKIGHSVTAYLSPKLPFTPYDLRHAWAVRTLEFGWPDALSAQQMGHSLEVHNRTYQRWINVRHHQRVYDLLVNRDDRPRPPTLNNFQMESNKS